MPTHTMQRRAELYALLVLAVDMMDTLNEAARRRAFYEERAKDAKQVPH